ncbi:MAG: hypothetical protein QM767_18575 [Anaeromyxobacter sp.]
MILNLAVGAPDFGMHSADEANGPMPQQLVVDYVRVYATAASSVEDKVAAQPHGRLCVLADGATCGSQLDPAADMALYLWNNLTQVTGTPQAGATSVAVKTTDGSWLGFGYATTRRRNLLNYAAGYLSFSIKTTAADDLKVGINGGNDGDSWVELKQDYAFPRDGQWHQLSIPMTRFGSADFTDIRQYFMVAGANAVTPGAVFEFDEISWSENAPENLTRPVGTRFGVSTERSCDAGSFDSTGDGSIFIWNPANGALTAGPPSEGANGFTLTAAAPQWYGLGFAPARLYDLGAFAHGHLHISLKVPASTGTDFKLGLKSPGGMAVRESWIKFKAGADPYGFVRDGQYHELSIPASDFPNSDLGAVSLLLMIAGDGPATISFDDVYWTAD